MSRRQLLLLGGAVALLAVLYSSITKDTTLKAPAQHPQGRNNITLFISDPHHGFSNVLLATSHALLLSYPQVSIHFASSSKLSPDVSKISNSAAKSSSKIIPIKFHPLSAPSYTQALNNIVIGMENYMYPPGLRGITTLTDIVQDYLMPWTGLEYLSHYHTILSLLEEIDPAVVAVDPMFAPALGAIRKWGGNYVVISPNSLTDSFARIQPRGEVLWKYPIVGSGISYPVPWKQIPLNIYLTSRFLFATLFAPKLRSKRAFLRENGVEHPVDGLSLYEENDRCLWISQGMKEGSYPLSVIPSNVMAVGPIYLSAVPAATQDPELAKWLAKGPTVWISLGSVNDIDEAGAREIVKALRVLYDNVPKVQVLWKLRKRSDFGEEYLEGLKREKKEGRLRVVRWLDVDPAALMETGDVRCVVHHGGASSFNDALGSGTPHVVLPMWADTYDYANLVEWLGIGAWANRETAPFTNGKELGEKLLTVCGEGKEAAAMKEKAKQLSEIYHQSPGRETAAREIARLAGIGRV